MATDYRRFMASEAPPWLRREPGGAWLKGAGDVKDALIQRAREGVKARFPSATVASDDALGVVGTERLIPRAPGEASEDYARRLRGAWEIWPWAGTPYGMLRALAESSYTGAYIGTQTRRFSLDANGDLSSATVSWTVGYDPTFWNAFEVLFVPPFPTSWGGTVPADGSPHAEFIKRMIRLWKPAHAIPGRVIVYESGELWGWPEGVWSGSTTWGSGSVTYWYF